MLQDPAFSPKALSEQEHVVIKYADMLITAIKEESRKGVINMTDYYNWVTFDGNISRLSILHFL